MEQHTTLLNHDGFALGIQKVEELIHFKFNSKKDVLSPFVKAVNKQGLKLDYIFHFQTGHILIIPIIQQILGDII